MKGVIVIPDILFNFPYYDYNLEIALMFRDITNYPVMPYSNFDKSLYTKIDTLISVQAPSNWCQFIQSSFPMFGAIPERIKFIYWVDEIQWENNKVREEMKRYMDRANVLICPSKSLFEHWYPQFTHKLKFIPWFAHQRFISDEINPSPILQCLATGGTNKNWYPLRHLIESNSAKLGNMIKLIMHPHTSRDKYIFNDFANLLKSYLCFATSSGSSRAITHRFDGNLRVLPNELKTKYPDIDWDVDVGHVYLKLFEIPATGCLLLCDNRPNELKDLGFIDGHNYVAIDKDNVFDKIEHCLKNPEEYKEIRTRGMSLIKEKHLRANRMFDFKKALGIGHKSYL